MKKILFLVFLFSLFAGAEPPYTYQFTSFDSPSEALFTGFTSNPNGSQRITTNTDSLLFGTHGHVAVTSGQRDTSNLSALVHREYPYLLVDSLYGHCMHGPMFMRIHMRVFANLQIRAGLNDWFSPHTFSPDSVRTGGTWDSVITTILTGDHPNYLSFFHVPRTGQSTLIFQASDANTPDHSLRFPYGQWVLYNIFYNPDPVAGYVKMWQSLEGQKPRLISYASALGRQNRVCAMHFGEYSSPATGLEPNQRITVENDNLEYGTVKNEAEFVARYINSER